MKITKFQHVVLWILFNLLFLIITPNAVSQITVRSQDSKFRFEPFPFQRSKYSETKSVNTIQGIQWLEKNNPTKRGEGNKMVLKDNTGKEIISIKTINPVTDFKTNGNFLYTLELDKTTFHIRKYKLDDSSRVTTKSLALIKSSLKPVSSPQRLFISTDEFILVYVYSVGDSTRNLRIERYPFANTKSKKSITIPNVPRTLGIHGDFYFKDNFLYMKGVIQDLPYKVIYELIKIDIETAHTTKILTMDNFHSYGFDNSKNKFYYITGESEYIEKTKETIPKGFFLNTVPLNEISSTPHKEKLPFFVCYGTAWDDNLNKFIVSLPENDERNDSSLRGGGFFTISPK